MHQPIDGCSQNGFTLLECVIAMAIIAIATVVFASNIPRMKATWRLNTAARNMVADFNLARSQALKDGVNCVIRFNTGGYSIFRDANGDFNPDKTFKTIQWSDYGGHLSVSNTFPSGALAYGPDGLTSSPGGGFGGGTLTITNSLGKQRLIIVSLTGTVRIQ